MEGKTRGGGRETVGVGGGGEAREGNVRGGE